MGMMTAASLGGIAFILIGVGIISGIGASFILAGICVIVYAVVRKVLDNAEQTETAGDRSSEIEGELRDILGRRSGGVEDILQREPEGNRRGFAEGGETETPPRL